MNVHFKLKPLIPFFVILIFTIIGYLFDFLHPISWEELKNLHLKIQSFAEIHPLLTPILFMGFYILYALFSLPGIFALSLLAGSLFIEPFSMLYVVFAATIGASLLFLAARTAFGQLFYRHAGPRLRKMEAGFHKNAANYLLFLRFIPLFPFSIVNMAGAFFKVPFWTFVWTTFVGMIPSVFVYTEAGKGLTMLLHSSDPFKLANIFNPYMIVALVGLSFLSILPILLGFLKVKI